MPLSWNGVAFDEQCPESPTALSIAPTGESRMSISGWFDWDDIISQAASKAYLGWCQVATAYQPLGPNGTPLPGLSAAPPGMSYFSYVNPLAHPDWPNQWYLADSFEQVKGFIPNVPSIGPNLTATFEEALTTIHFRSPKNGYRCLPDFMMLDQFGGRAGGVPWGIPREYFCTRNMEIIEKTTTKMQTIPGNGGLMWQVLNPDGSPGLGKNASTANFISLPEGNVTIKWFPVPLTGGGFNESAALDLIGKTNDAAFPPVQPIIPGVSPPASFLTRRGGQKALATLVWGQPEKEIIRMGDGNWALSITLRLSHHAHGANSFFWWNPPTAARGRIRIDPADGPVQDPRLGGPGYYLMARPDGTVLFPPGDYRAPFLPAGQTM